MGMAKKACVRLGPPKLRPSSLDTTAVLALHKGGGEDDVACMLLLLTCVCVFRDCPILHLREAGREREREREREDNMK